MNFSNPFMAYRKRIAAKKTNENNLLLIRYSPKVLAGVVQVNNIN